MSEQHIDAAALKQYLHQLGLEHLRTQMMVSGMRRMTEYSGEMSEEDLAGLALELEALLEILTDRLATHEYALEFETVERRCLALAELKEIRQAEEGGEHE